MTTRNRFGDRLPRRVSDRIDHDALARFLDRFPVSQHGALLGAVVSFFDANVGEAQPSDSGLAFDPNQPNADLQQAFLAIFLPAPEAPPKREGSA